MIFFMAMPFLTGLINYVVPLQIGARDMAFPYLNSVGFWLTAAGSVLMMASLVIGEFSTGGWSGYPPYTELSFSGGPGPDYWIWAVSPVLARLHNRRHQRRSARSTSSARRA